ncbi:addiction module killer protein [Flavobacterium sufflavum]|uniref:Addiction module killer protein n=2 Tax=Flavobacterium sufflavum TaxID=1921138 RepID=A0A3S2USM6_9FLAO|nr:addiction module killer protein [Flavobacterium sufflavum]
MYICSQIREQICIFAKPFMEIIFKKQYLSDLYQGIVKPYKEYKSNPQLVKQFINKINTLKTVTRIEQLYQIKSLQYEKKEGDLKGVSAVYVNKQYRILFTEVASTSDDLKIDILEIEDLSKHYEK